MINVPWLYTGREKCALRKEITLYLLHVLLEVVRTGQGSVSSGRPGARAEAALAAGRRDAGTSPPCAAHQLLPGPPQGLQPMHL